MSGLDFEHVLVPTDFSDAAKHASEVAIAMAKKFGAKVTLLHVYTVPVMAYEATVAWPLHDLEASAKQALDAELKRAQAEYPSCDGLVLPGYPPTEIVEVAKEHLVDLIVMGKHGRRGLPRLLLGSVAEKIVRTSPVPVLTVAPEEPERASATEPITAPSR